MDGIVARYLSAYQPDSAPLGRGEESVLADPWEWLEDRVALISQRAQPVVEPGIGSLSEFFAGLKETWRDFRDNPKAFFVSQYKSAFNTQEDTPGNGNCGPTCLTMVGMAFGKLSVAPEQADQIIEQTRLNMTGKVNQFTGTSFKQLKRGASAMNLPSREVGGSLDVLKQELAKGRLAICLISPAAMGPSTSTGHYVVVTKIDEQGIHCNDPAKKGGPVVYSPTAFSKGWKARGSLALSIGA